MIIFNMAPTGNQKPSTQCPKPIATEKNRLLEAHDLWPLKGTKVLSILVFRAPI